MENNLENISLRAPKNEEETDLIIKYWCEIFGDTRAFASDFYTWSGKENTLAAFSGEELLGFCKIRIQKKRCFFGSYEERGNIDERQRRRILSCCSCGERVIFAL